MSLDIVFGPRHDHIDDDDGYIDPDSSHHDEWTISLQIILQIKSYLRHLVELEKMG